MTPTRILAALGAAALTATLGVAPSAALPSVASAPAEGSRLPSAQEAQEIYPYLEGGDRRVVDVRRLEAPNPEDLDGGGLGCVYHERVAKAANGRDARYRTASPTSRSATLVAAVRSFSSSARARAAYETVVRRVERCEGTFPTRAGSIERRELELPRFGRARVGYRETDDGFSARRVRFVVLRDRRVVVTDHVRYDGPPSQDRLERLTWRTLRGVR